MDLTEKVDKMVDERETLIAKALLDHGKLTPTSWMSYWGDRVIKAEYQIELLKMVKVDGPDQDQGNRLKTMLAKALAQIANGSFSTAPMDNAITDIRKRAALEFLRRFARETEWFSSKNPANWIDILHYL